MRFRSGFTIPHLLLALAAVAIVATAVTYTVDRLSPTVSPDPLRAAIERHGLTVTGRGQSTGTIQLTSSYLAQVPGSLYQIACNKSGYDLTASPDAEVTITKYPIAQRYQDAATNEPLDALVFHQGNRVLCIYKAVRGGAISPGVFGADEDTIAPFSSAPVGDQAVCTADAKQCPDGSYVSRVAPNCEFAACPATNTNSTANVNAVTNTNTVSNTNTATDLTKGWKTYTNTTYGYSIKYPDDYRVTSTPNGDLSALIEKGAPGDAGYQFISILSVEEGSATSKDGNNVYAWARDGFPFDDPITQYHGNPRNVTLGELSFVATDGDTGSSGIPEYLILHKKILYQFGSYSPSAGQTSNKEVISTLQFTD